MVFQIGHKEWRRNPKAKKKRPYRNGVDKNMQPEKVYQQGFLSKLDGRTEVYLNLDRTYRAIISDLGGFGSVSRIERSLVERYVFCEYHIRELEVRMSKNGDNTELFENWIKLNNAINSIAAKLGVAIRKPKGGKLKEYIKEKTE